MILVVDSVRHAGEHLELNSSILESLIEADGEIDFLTSPDYWNSFSSTLRERMELQSSARLPHGLIGTLRSLLLLIMIVIFKRKYKSVVFLSSITYNSFFLALFSYLRIIKPKIIIFLHEISYIESIKGTTKLAGYFLKLALYIGLKNQSKFIIIGSYIRWELEKRVNFNKESTIFIEHPISVSTYYKPKDTFKLIKFASTGVQCVEKNSFKIEIIAEYSRDLVKSGAIALSTIGRVNYSFDLKLPVTHIGLDYNNYLMPIEDYERYILDQHYLLFFLGKEYDLKTSGTIVDSIKYQKPIIALSCNLVNFYFEKFGNIGYVYRCIDEMNKGILNLCKNFDPELYSVQVKNLTKANDQMSGTQFRREIQQLLLGKK